MLHVIGQRAAFTSPDGVCLNVRNLLYLSAAVARLRSTDNEMAVQLRSAGKQKESLSQQVTARATKLSSDTAELASLLVDVGATTASGLAAASATMYVPRRTAIYTQGDKSTGLYVVISGRVKLSLPLPHSEERVVALHGPGAWFGESALLLNEPHLLSATTLEDCKLVHIPAAAVLRCLRQDPTFAVCLLTEISRRLREATLEGTAAGWSPARQRVIGFLLDQITSTKRLEDRITIELPAAKQVVASRLNIQAETFSRVLRELTRDRLIDVQRRRIAVPSVTRLQSACAECDTVRKRAR